MLGSRYGYYDPANAYNIDSVIELFEEANNNLGKLLFMQGDEEQKKQELERQVEQVHKPALAYFEKQLSDHLGPFIAGEKLTIADFCVFALRKNLYQNPAFGDIFSQLLKQFECVEHYLRETDKEIPIVVEEDLKGGVEGRANPA